MKGFEWFRGKKSYIIAILMVIAAGLRAQKYIDDVAYQLIEGVLLGGGIAALRAGVSKV